MKKYFLVLLALATAVPAVWAGPCDDDFDKTCGDVQPGSGALADCINTNRDKFTSQCREWLTKMDTTLKRLHGACTNDARNFCRDVRPGYGRVVSCLRSNMDKLSPSCRDALK